MTDFDVDENAEARDGARITCSLEEINTDPYGIIVPPRSPGREAIAWAAELDTQLEGIGLDDETIAETIAESGYPLTDEELGFEEGTTFESLASDFQEGLTLGTAYAERVAAQVDRMRARVRAVTELAQVRTASGFAAYASALRLIESVGQQGDRAIARAVASVVYQVRSPLSSTTSR